jgi:hypothetical protein
MESYTWQNLVAGSIEWKVAPVKTVVQEIIGWKMAPECFWCKVLSDGRKHRIGIWADIH